MVDRLLIEPRMLLIEIFEVQFPFRFFGFVIAEDGFGNIAPLLPLFLGSLALLLVLIKLVVDFPAFLVLRLWI